eukprot:scaffold38316_cov67-Phaeocystis_antarctica.AAC.5
MDTAGTRHSSTAVSKQPPGRHRQQRQSTTRPVSQLWVCGYTTRSSHVWSSSRSRGGNVDKARDELVHARVTACEGQTVGVLRVWHEQPRPEYGEGSNRMCDGFMANLGRPPVA